MAVGNLTIFQRPLEVSGNEVPTAKVHVLFGGDRREHAEGRRAECRAESQQHLATRTAYGEARHSPQAFVVTHHVAAISAAVHAACRRTLVIRNAAATLQFSLSMSG